MAPTHLIQPSSSTVYIIPPGSRDGGQVGVGHRTQSTGSGHCGIMLFDEYDGVPVSPECPQAPFVAPSLNLPLVAAILYRPLVPRRPVYFLLSSTRRRNDIRKQTPNWNHPARGDRERQRMCRWVYRYCSSVSTSVGTAVSPGGCI